MTSTNPRRSSRLRPSSIHRVNEEQEEQAFHHSPLLLSCSPLSTKDILPLNNALFLAARAINSAKRIVVITGAGISVSADIPDFRSPNGLYNLVKLPVVGRGPGTKGRDLFDASVFRCADSRKMFYSFMSGLRDRCHAADPTPAHHMLRRFETNGQLLRCYTQNIDNLEFHAGLGLPSTDGSDITSRKPIVVNLHGSLAHVRCVLCAHTFPFTHSLSTVFANGDPPSCPICLEDAQCRAALGKRARATGTLRPDVVLYNEDHPSGDLIATILAKDLRSKPDLVLVMGTSLKVHGIKRMLKQLTAAVRPKGAVPLNYSTPVGGDQHPILDHKLSLPQPSIVDSHPRIIYINKTPLTNKEWQSTFDLEVHCDADKFANHLLRYHNRPAKGVGAGIEHGQTLLNYPKVKHTPVLSSASSSCSGASPVFSMVHSSPELSKLRASFPHSPPPSRAHVIFSLRDENTLPASPLSPELAATERLYPRSQQKQSISSQ